MGDNNKFTGYNGATDELLHGKVGSYMRSYEADRNATSEECVYTTSNGVPIPHPYEVQRVGPNGPLLLQDFHLIDLLSHFDRERIPERVVHAKGSGAHGIFECTDDASDLCLAQMFKKGFKCPVSARFSTVGGESGSSDVARDPRGFSVKFKTPEGTWDWVGNNTPVFFLRDPAKFPHFIHTQKRNPRTHLTHADDSTDFWGYLSENPESIHQVLILMSPRGIPDGYRHMHGYFGHTLKLVRHDGTWVYAQFHFKSDQGIKTLTAEEAAEKSPDYAQKDLVDAIDNGNFPSWTLQVQTMTQEQAEKAWKEDGINVHDLTHTWPQGQYKLRTIGKMTLNELPMNYHAETELIAFNPAHLINGVESSADPVLQSRLFSYPDAHRHRIGVNYQQLPVNQPVVPYKMANFQRDGQMAFYNQGSRPNYLSSISPIQFKERQYSLDSVHGKFVGESVSWLSTLRPEDFNAPRALWQRVFSDEDRRQTIKNISTHMANCKEEEIIKKQIAIFRAVSDDFAEGIEKAMGIKGYNIEDLTFNGSHTSMHKSSKTKVANGQSPEGIVIDNGGPAY